MIKFLNTIMIRTKQVKVLKGDKMEEVINIVNHEAWIEVEDGKGYLKWGHYPEVDGKLDPQSIVRAFAVAGDRILPVFIGIEKESLLLEFEEAEVLVVEWDRGIYALTEDNKWFYRRAPGKVKERRWILGFAKVYLSDNIKPVGTELEIIPNGNKIEVLFRGKPINCKIKVRNSKGTFEFNSGEEIELAEGINVISARYIDELTVGADKRNLVATLTIRR